MGIFNLFKKKKNEVEIESPIYLDEISEHHDNKQLDDDIQANSIDSLLESHDKQQLVDILAHKELNLPIESDFFADKDPLFEEAARLIVVHQQGSVSLIQRKFVIGYNRAGRLMDQLEMAGIVGPALGTAPREVVIVDIFSLEDKLKYLPQFPQDLMGLASVKYRTDVDERKAIILENIEREQELQRQRELEAEKEQVKQLLIEKERKRQLKRQIRKELIEEGVIGKSSKRESIPQDLQDRVWNRDKGQCVKCGSNENLEFDHVIPFSKGGATSYRNLQLLCQKCNREKSNSIG